MSHQVPIVPTISAEITAVWLQTALAGAFPDLEIETWTVERIGEAYGLASEIYRCRWHESDSVVVKLWPTDSKAGVKEVQFYGTFGANTGARIPACFYAAVDEGRKRGVLVLEDLVTAVQGDCLLQLDLYQAQAVAKNMAGYHATWYQHEGLAQTTWLPSVARWQRDESWFAPRRTLFLQRFGDRLDDLAHALLACIGQAPALANNRLKDAPSTLLHADLHLDNFVFVEGTEPVILDWAGCVQGPLVLDLYQLLFNMCQAQDRERVLALYVEAFAERAGFVLDGRSLHSQLGGAFLRQFATATCGVARWQPTSAREAAMIEVSVWRTLQAAHYWHEHDPALFAFLE